MRIIGGDMRGRRLIYHGDPRTRPMKERVREAAFNLLGPAVQEKRALDLFAGTGALGLEAISRGAAEATFLERHFPTARVISQNAESLGVLDLVEVITGNTFLWPRQQTDWSPLQDCPWIVFCSPPYDFYVEKSEEMLQLLEVLREKAPAETIFLVESDDRFDFAALASWGEWDVRKYSPAILGKHVIAPR